MTAPMPCLSQEHRYKLRDMIIPYADTPLSQGADIMLLTYSRCFSSRYHCTQEDVDVIVAHHGDSEAMYLFFPDTKTHVIWISSAVTNPIRTIELIAHETTHMVDEIFKQTKIKLIDTELRAYLTDHVVGLLASRLVLNQFYLTVADRP
jgi:hypothetical protein